MSSSLVERLRERAGELGFCLLRVTDAAVFERERDALLGRIEAGLLAEMRWIDAERARVSTDPTALLSGARSVISVAMPYGRPGHAWRGGRRGRIARYAWARDYHGVMKGRMGALRELLLAEAPGEAVAVVVDTGRVVDRAVAVRSGLGWYGKNAMVLSPSFGSWLMLGELVTTLALPADEPLRKSCGRCTRCLDLCPTGAIIAPGVIDSRRCISYLTIEHRGPIPTRLRPLIGAWIFGCDVCQEVCPVNDATARVAGGADPLEPVLDPEPELEPLLRLTRDEWRRRYHDTPVGRAGYAGLLRNVCVALGNVGDASSVPALAGALAHPEALVRAHAAWALGRIGGPAARAALVGRRDEPDPDVLAEIDAALADPAS